MNADAVAKRLSELSTAWSLIDRTRHGPGESASMAIALLVERYQSAAYRYLLAAVRDQHAADELFQEFALRLVRGDFGKADPLKGRFRDYVKKALINLATTYHNQQKRRDEHAPLEAEPAAPEFVRFDSDAEFLLDWRQALLERTWSAFSAEHSAAGAPLYSVLKLRNEYPDAAMAELAERLTALKNPAQPYTDVGVRKLLQRAREKFTDLLVDEVACSMGKRTDEELEEELFDLGFQAHCRGAMERRRVRRGK